MYPPSPYAKPRGSFETPVLPPTEAPSAEPTQTVVISCVWLPFIRGALKQLLLQSTWDLSGGADLATVQGNVFDLIDLFQECSTSTIPFHCSGDLRAEENPFSTFSITWCPSGDAIGIYVGMAGYQGTVGHAGPLIYNGVTLDIVFDSLVTINTLRLLYDMSLGSTDNPSTDNIIVYDCLNHAIIGTPQTFSLAESGSGLTYDAVGPSASTNHVAILLAASAKSGSDPDIPGLCYLIGIDVFGTTGGDPCG